MTMCCANLKGLAKKVFRIDQDSTAKETGKSFNIQEESGGSLLSLFLTTLVGHGKDTWKGLHKPCFIKSMRLNCVCAPQRAS